MAVETFGKIYLCSQEVSYHVKPLKSCIAPGQHSVRFSDSGYASMRARASNLGANVFLPDPCETCFIVQTKTSSTPVRARQFVDLPGSNATRGLSGLLLKSPEQHQVQVKKEVAEALCRPMAAAMGDDDNDAASGGEGPQTPTSAETGLRPIWPFTSCLELHRELLNMYSIPQTRVVNFTSGFGQTELACILHDTHCTSFVSSVKHREAREKDG